MTTIETDSKFTKIVTETKTRIVMSRKSQKSSYCEVLPFLCILKLTHTKEKKNCSPDHCWILSYFGNHMTTGVPGYSTPYTGEK